MKKYLILVFLLISFNSAIAQQMTVNATITDSDGQAWIGGSWSIQVYSPSGRASFNGTPIPMITQSGALDIAGSFSTTLYNTASLTPRDVSYTFTLCSNTSAPCSVFTTPVVSTNLSSLLSSKVTVPRFASGVNSYGYTDSEVTTASLNIGAVYYNVLSLSQRQWNGSVWTSGSSGGGAVLPTGVVCGTSPTTGVPCSSTSITNAIGTGVYDNAGSASAVSSTLTPLVANAQSAANTAINNALAAHNEAARYSVLDDHGAGRAYCDVTFTPAASPTPTNFGTWTSGHDDTAAIQATFNAAGLFINPPLNVNVQGQEGNAPQGLVQFPPGRICGISSTIYIPPGSGFDGGIGSEVHQFGTGDAFYYVYNLDSSGAPITTGYYGYGSFYNFGKNMQITGPGPLVSNGIGIHTDISNYAIFDRVDIKGFKHPIEGDQLQYSHITNSNFYYNLTGPYLTVDPEYPGLPSIDNHFDNIVSRDNVKYGLWCQACSGNRFFGVDLNFNGDVDRLEGPPPAPYYSVNGYTITGGSGCTYNSASPYLPGAYNDTGGGTELSFYVTVNSSGVPIKIQGTDGGYNMTSSTTFSVPGCTTQPTITGTRVVDIGNVVGNVIGGGSSNNTWIDFKAEDAANIVGSTIPGIPNTGYFSIMTSGNTRDLYSDLTPDSGSLSFARFNRNIGVGNLYSHPKILGYGNPAINAGVVDTCLYRNTSGTQTLEIIGAVPADVFNYACPDGNTLPDLGGTSYNGFDNASNRYLSLGLVAKGGYFLNPAISGGIFADTIPRFNINYNGDFALGAGGTSPWDVILKRTQAGLLGLGLGNIDAGAFNIQVSGGTYPAKYFWIQSTGSGISRGLENGANCYISQRWSGNPGYYFEVAECMGYGTGIHYYNNYSTIGAENYTLAITPAGTGQRYACVDTNGTIVSSVAPCSGTE